MRPVMDAGHVYIRTMPVMVAGIKYMRPVRETGHVLLLCQRMAGCKAMYLRGNMFTQPKQHLPFFCSSQMPPRKSKRAQKPRDLSPQEPQTTARKKQKPSNANGPSAADVAKELYELMKKDQTAQEPLQEDMPPGDEPNTGGSQDEDGDVELLPDDVLDDDDEQPVQQGILNRPIDSTVDKKVKSQIWAGKYVDLGTLISDNKPQILDIQTKSGKVGLVPRFQTFRIYNIEKWHEAFRIFVAIHTQKFANDAPGLMKYASLVNTIASEHGDWQFYDANFRKWKAQANISWDDFNTELYSRAMSRGINKSLFPKGNAFQKGKRQDQPFREKGYNSQSRKPNKPYVCYTFNNTGKCTRNGCPFPHKCQLCSGNHSKSVCSGAQSSSASNKGNNSGKK